MDCFQIFGFAVFWLGGWCVWKSVNARRRRTALLRDPVRYSGTVIRLEDISSEGDVGPTMYVPVVKYRVGGHDYEARLTPTRDDIAFRVGKKAEVMFERGNPANVTDKAKLTWDVNVALTASLALFLIGAVLFCGSLPWAGTKVEVTWAGSPAAKK